MKSSVTKDFRKRLDQLPVTVQEQATRAYTLWRSEARDFNPGQLRSDTNQAGVIESAHAER